MGHNEIISLPAIPLLEVPLYSIQRIPYAISVRLQKFSGTSVPSNESAPDRPTGRLVPPKRPLAIAESDSSIAHVYLVGRPLV